MRRLSYTQKEIKTIKDEIEKYLTTPQMNHKDLSLFMPKVSRLKPEDKPRIIFSDKAAKIIKALVAQCPDEVAWNCTVYKKKNNVYYIKDVVMFPQIVTGTAVDVNETEYANWLATLPADVFNNLRFHGHSHVNMAVNPSGIDTKYQSDMLQNLTDFYIYMIFNKRGEFYACIYDIKALTFYERDDIIVQFGVKSYEDEAAQLLKEYVKHPTVKSTALNNWKKDWQREQRNAMDDMIREESARDRVMYMRKCTPQPHMTVQEIRDIVDNY